MNKIFTTQYQLNTIFKVHKNFKIKQSPNIIDNEWRDALSKGSTHL